MEKNKHSIDRTKFYFYKSYWECYKQLKNNKEKLEFLEIILKTSFLEQDLEQIKPSNYLVNILFSSIKHSLKTSICGFLTKIDTQGTTQGGTQGATQGGTQEIIISNKKDIIGNRQEEYLNLVIKSWVKSYPEEFKKDGHHQVAFVIQRRKELEKLNGIAEIIDYVQTYHNKTLLEDGNFKIQEEAPREKSIMERYNEQMKEKYNGTLL
jgi:hypothetical protein